MTLFSFGAVSPWLTILDHDRFGRTVDAVHSLGAKTIASCHTPVLVRSFIEQALETTRGVRLSSRRRCRTSRSSTRSSPPTLQPVLS
jgi:hypothetical protein